MAFMKVPVSEYLSQLAEKPRTDPVVAYFDLDRTLIDGYSLTALALQQVANQGISVKRFFSLSFMFLGYGIGRTDYAQLLEATVNDIRGMPEEELTRLGHQAFDRRLARWVYKEGFDLVDAHRQLGHDVVMITSATRYQAAPIAAVLNIEHMACTELEIVDGRVAGGVVPCYGAGKLDAARRYARSTGARLADAYFYSDSQEDLPLLEGVGHPVVVNGKSKLIRISEGRGWPNLEFQQTGWVATQAA